MKLNARRLTCSHRALRRCGRGYQRHRDDEERGMVPHTPIMNLSQRGRLSGRRAARAPRPLDSTPCGR
jgi:hypothetical protein